MGASASTVLTYNPGAPFYCLFALMALDLFLSVTSFMNEFGSQVASESDIAMRFLDKGRRL